jgi:predicted outer membrane repeat protein
LRNNYRVPAIALRICAALILVLILLPSGGSSAQEAGSPAGAPDAADLNGTVRALVFDGAGTLYAGGDFTTAGSTNLNRVTRWDGAAWQPLGPAATPGFDGSVLALAFSPTGVLYAGGNFGFSTSGASLSRIARWDGANWQPLGAGINGPVKAIAFDASGNLYAGGEFSSAGGIPVHNIAKWDGSAWSALGNGVTGGDYPNVSALLWDGGSLYVGGRFTTAGAVTANHIARWDGAAWHALANGVGDGVTYAAVYALVKDGANIVAAGDFPTIGATAVGSIARWNGSTWQPLDSGVDGWVFALAKDTAGNLYAGGQFTTAGGVPVHNVAQWRLYWAALGAGMNAAVYALAVDPSAKPLAGGQFTSPTDYVARWNGAIWAGMGSATPGSRLYVKPSAGVLRNCSSWGDACDLDEAMRRAISGSEIWAAGGNYTPIQRTSPDDPASATFYLAAGARLYGGFAGNETTLDQRDWQANPTILDGNDAVYSVVTLENAPPETLVDGFIITGSAPTGPSSWTSGAIHVEGGQALLQHLVLTGNAGIRGGGLTNRNGDLTLRDVTFQDNTAQIGGAGIWNETGNLTLENVRLTRNKSDHTGGGIYHGAGALTLHSVSLTENSSNHGGGIYNENGTLLLTDVTFFKNNGSGGGGLWTGGDAVLRRVTFEQNMVRLSGGGGMYGSGDLEDVVFTNNSADGGSGGGMYAAGATLQNVTFNGGYAYAGGALYCDDCTLTEVAFNGGDARFEGGGMRGSGTLTNVVFNGSHSSVSGGGFYGHGELTNVVFHRTSARITGGGIYGYGGELHLTNTTFYANKSDSPDRGTAISTENAGSGAITIVNTVLRGDPAVDPEVLIHDPAHKVTITYSDVEGGYPGTGNIDADPRFVDPAGGNLRLQASSPAIDVGNTSAVPPGITTDLEGMPRVSGAAVDMGAYEYQHAPAPTQRLYLPLIMRN